MEGFINNSFLLSLLYRLMLYSAMFPAAYFIMMVVGGLRHRLGMSVWGIILRTITGWLLIIALYILCGALLSFTMQDLGAFIDAKTKSSIFVRYYPVAVFIIAMAGFWYPRADFFNLKRTRFKRGLLCVVCFTPLYLMLGYMFWVTSELWELCLRFGVRSSLLAFTISFPMIFHDAPDALSQAWRRIIQFLFKISLAKPKKN